MSLSSGWFVYVCVLMAQSHPTLCNPTNCSLPGSSVHGILQASGLPFPFPGNLSDPGIKPGLLHCRQILYHLNHQGNSGVLCYAAKNSQHTLSHPYYFGLVTNFSMPPFMSLKMGITFFYHHQEDRRGCGMLVPSNSPAALSKSY